MAYGSMPETIPGMNPAWMTDLGKAVKRDPDALSPKNGLEMVMNWIYRAAVSMGGGNVLFALKAGALTGQPLARFFFSSSFLIVCPLVMLSLPSFLKSTAQFAYSECARIMVLLLTDNSSSEQICLGGVSQLLPRPLIPE